VHSPFWEGLVDWIKGNLMAEGMISAEEPDLFRVLDKPQDVVDAIFHHYEHRGFELSAEEQEMMLDL
jgi:hypothetical protein